ncbi:MAG: FeoA domain-containing protein [Acidobacteria bacterium]|nr:FeoA domain-containing protein [Acidobacteriota bacterium]MDE2978839.1 FeoA domain-containing protein [Acidobacteriota bacterium]
MDRTLADVADASDERLLEIAEVTGTGADSRRLREIGFCAGAPIRFVRRAPLGDPAMYELRGALLSLRRSEARRIRVHRVAE